MSIISFWTIWYLMSQKLTTHCWIILSLSQQMFHWCSKSMQVWAKLLTWLWILQWMFVSCTTEAGGGLILAAFSQCKQGREKFSRQNTDRRQVAGDLFAFTPTVHNRVGWPPLEGTGGVEGWGGGVGGRREGGPCGEPLRLNLMITLSFPVDTASGLLSGPSQ